MTQSFRLIPLGAARLWSCLWLISCVHQQAEAPPASASTDLSFEQMLPMPVEAGSEVVMSLGQLYEAAFEEDRALRRLQYLSDHIGHRLGGSENLERAIQWSSGELQSDGFQVELQPVQIPHWERGDESAQLLSPVDRELEILGLGMTVGGVVEGEVVALSSFEELERTDVQNKIVLFDVPFTTYGETVAYRLNGASKVAAKGGMAMLLRSVTPVSLNTPHTGTLFYDEAYPAIPAAALTVEDATWLHRLFDDGQTVRVRLSLGAQHHGMVTSHNVIADLPGSETPEEAVLVGCHLDSWDVGQGTQDDGAGCMIAWEAANLIRELGWKHRRTIRVVLYTAEETGIWGGQAFAEQRAEDYQWVAALESDIGNGRVEALSLDLSGFPVEALQTVVEQQAQDMQLALSPLGLISIERGGSGADIGPLVRTGVPGFGLRHNTTDYWPIHHTAADTFEKIIPEDLAHNVGMMAAAVYYLAQMESPFIEDSE